MIITSTVALALFNCKPNCCSRAVNSEGKSSCVDCRSIAVSSIHFNLKSYLPFSPVLGD